MPGTDFAVMSICCQSITISDIVQVVADIHAPTLLSWPDPETGPWSIRVHWQDIDGRPECIGLELWNGSAIDGGAAEGRTPAPITATGLRGLKPDALIQAARHQYVQEIEAIAAGFDRSIAAGNRKAGRGRTKRSPYAAKDVPLTAGTAGAPQTQALRQKAQNAKLPRKAAKGSKRRGRPPGATYPPDFWDQVAEVYSAAHRAGLNPTAEVEVAFGKSHSQAGKYIAHCRALGKLPPTTRGRAKS